MTRLTKDNFQTPLAEQASLNKQELMALERFAQKQLADDKAANAGLVFGLLASLNPFRPRNWRGLKRVSQKQDHPALGLVAHSIELLVDADADDIEERVEGLASLITAFE